MAGLFERRRIRRRRDGTFAVDLPAHERELLAAVAGQLEDLLVTAPDDPALVRLFPTAYADRPELDEEYHALVRDDLVDRHRKALITLRETASASSLTEEELAEWTGALNQVRLVLGTRLNVTEEMDEPRPDDPEGHLLAVYHYLSWLMEHAVAALRQTL